MGAVQVLQLPSIHLKGAKLEFSAEGVVTDQQVMTYPSNMPPLTKTGMHAMLRLGSTWKWSMKRNNPKVWIIKWVCQAES